MYDLTNTNPIPQTPEDREDEGDGEAHLGLNISEEERHDEEDDELYRDVNINQGRGLQGTLEVKDTHVTLTPVKPDGQQESSSVSSQFVASMLNQTLDVGTESIFETTSRIDVQTPTFMAPLPITTPTMTSSTIATTTPTSQTPILPTTIPSDIIQHLPSFGSLFHFDDRLRSLEKHFSEVTQTNQFAGAVSAIPGIVQHYMDQRMNKEVKVSVQIQSDRLCQVDAYESDKIILNTYKETVTLKRRRDDDEDKDEEPSAELDRGSKRRREGKEPESASALSKTATKSDGRSTTGSRSQQASASESAFAKEPHPEWFSQPQKPPTPDHDWNKTLPAVHGSIQPWISDLAKQANTRSSFKLEYHLEEVYKATTDQLDRVNPEGQQYPHNLLQPLPLIPDNRSHHVIPFTHFINNVLKYLRGGASSRKYTTSVTKTKAAEYGHIKWIKDLVPKTMWIQEPIDYDKDALSGVSHWGRKRQQLYGFAVNRESTRDVYSKRRIIVVMELKIVECHSYKHLDWITRHVEDLQLGVESYQKRLNLTKPDTYRSDLKRKEAYTAYSNPRGFIYQNKDKKNRLMQINELHKFSDRTLTDVRTALDDRLKGIRMLYLPQTIWRKSDKDRAAAMIQAIDKRLKTKRIMRSLKRFVEGRL
nr:hypothetical protein [Tanacetum cinerariifolium]